MAQNILNSGETQMFVVSMYRLVSALSIFPMCGEAMTRVIILPRKTNFSNQIKMPQEKTLFTY